MNKVLYISALITLSSIHANAQSVNMDQVLQSIVTNNKTLQAGSHLNNAQKLEAHTGNYLANPTVELNQLWGDKETGGSLSEWKIAQSFDFPTVYSNKNKLATLKSSASDLQLAGTRQQILLSAQQICLEIIYLRKEKEILEKRLGNAKKLTLIYQKRLDKGEGNQLEMNKIKLEQINTQNQARLNESALQSKLEQLRNFNGGEPIAFTDNTYPSQMTLPAFEQLLPDFLSGDPNLKSLTNQVEIAGQEIRLSRAQSLPKFDLGYRRNKGTDETMNGFVVGLSIPLFENKNTVRKAKAQFEYSNAVVEDNTQTIKSNLQQYYAQAQALQVSIKEYSAILSTQESIELLNRALIAGQLTAIDYFSEISTIYDSQQSYLNIERDYFNTLAILLQYKL